MKDLVHALQVHQVELEMQNQALKEAQLSLTEARNRYQDLFDLAPVGYMTLAADGEIQEVNGAGSRILGASPSRLCGRRLGVFLVESSRPAFAAFLAGVRAGKTEPCEAELAREGAEPTCVRLDGVAGSGGSCRIAMTDVTERTRAERALQQSERGLRENQIALRSILGSTADGILAVDQDRRVVHANKRFSELWRIPAPLVESRDDEALLRYVLSQLVDPEKFLAKVEALYGTSLEDMDVLSFKDGRLVERYSSPMTMDGVVTGRVWSFRDVTERQRAEAELQRTNNSLEEANRKVSLLLERERELAQTDGLTGLYNRRHFFELAAREMANAIRHRRPLGIVMIDVDRLKEVNDSFGHLAGDQMLVALAQSALAQVRVSDVLARYGGDEFVLLVPQTTPDQARLLAERIRESVAARAVSAGGHELSVTLSIGIAGLWLDPPDPNVETVIQRADEALYVAKTGGRDRVVLWEPGLSFSSPSPTAGD